MSQKKLVGMNPVLMMSDETKIQLKNVPEIKIEHDVDSKYSRNPFFDSLYSIPVITNPYIGLLTSTTCLEKEEKKVLEAVNIQYPGWPVWFTLFLLVGLGTFLGLIQ